jgi:Mrp family chromosome partitioning ATPase
MQAMNGPTFAPAAPAAAAKPTPPRPAAPVKAPARPDAEPGGGLRILTYLRLHWLMITFCGTLLGGLGAFVAWDLLASKYESYALLQVSSVPSSLANPNNPSQARTDFVTYMKTTAGLIKYEFVLNAALRDVKDLPTIKAQPDPIKFLSEELQVSAADGSEVIKISIAGHNPQDTQKIVNAVQAAFMAEVVQTEVAEKKKFLAKVDTAIGNMRVLLEGKAPKTTKADPKPGDPAQPGAFGNANPGAAGPPQLDVKDGGPPAAAPAAMDVFNHNPALMTGNLTGQWFKYQDQIEALTLKINETKRRLAAIDADMVALNKAPVDKLTIEAVERDGEVAQQAIQVRIASRNYEYAKGLANGDPTTEEAVNRKKILDYHEATLARLKKEKLDAIETVRRQAEYRRLKGAWDETKRQLESFEEQLAAAKAGLDRTQAQLLALPAPEKKLDANGRPMKEAYSIENTDLMMTDSVFASLIRQYLQTKLELDSPARVRVLQTASSPTQRDTKKQILGTVFAGLMGYVLIMLGVIAYETLGRRVSSLSDLKSAGPAPVVGVIPCQPTEAVGRNPAKRAAANEAIDKLRAYVAQTWLSRGATTVAVTSPLGDEGKAFTAFGLASSLAQAGCKTLLVDFDLRDPVLHTYAGVPNQTGVCEILLGETDVRSAIQFLPNGLHLLPSGKWSDEARKAAVGGRLEALLAKLKEPYDCLVLHHHALLTVAESVEIARRCEVVLVCAQYRETKAPLLRKATDRVATMEIPYSGVVYVGATEQEALC